MKICSRSPRGNVDWNKGKRHCMNTFFPSFPTRERGLKLWSPGISLRSYPSFPTRERGLKCRRGCKNHIGHSVVPHEGTWIEISVLPLYLWLCHVVSHEGTWIEMEKKQCLGCLLSSFPTRERGLKSGYDLNFFSHFVSFPTQECGLKSRSHMRSL